MYTVPRIHGKDEKPESLSKAIAAATGVSSGTAYTIPKLLIPDSCSRSQVEKKHNYAKLIGTMKDPSGYLCYLVKINSDETYWIDVETFLIRKIEEYSKHDSFFTNSFTYYSPKTNIQIPGSKFIYKNSRLTNN